MKVTVEAVTSKPVKTRFGDKKTYSFKATDGQWYAMNFKKPEFVAGDVVDIETESTRYGLQVSAVNSVNDGAGSKGMPAAVPADASPTSAPYTRGGGSMTSKGVFPVPPTDGQRSIIRQNCVTNAREIVMPLIDLGVHKADDIVKEVIRVAKLLEAYSAGDTEAVEAAKMKKAEEKTVATK